MSPYERARLSPLGDCALVVSFGDDIGEQTNLKVRVFAEGLASEAHPAVVDHVPAFTSVTVFYDPARTTYGELASTVDALIDAMPDSISAAEATTVEIPVCYGRDLGPDLGFVADHNRLTKDEVIGIHCEPDYRVYMIGFAPGFPYLGGMSRRIATPRRDVPRDRIPAGSVGIAGEQTGVYSIETPGGWQIIGRTPLRLFRPDRNPPSLLKAGDRVRFTAIDRDRYDDLLGPER